MSAAPPTNRRRPESARPSAKEIEAPLDPSIGDDSPLPGPATTTVRPPSKKAAKAPRKAMGRFGRTVQLIAGIVVVLAASIGVAWGARHYLLTSPRFAVRTVVVDGNHRRTAAQVAAAGGVAVGQNIFGLDPVLAQAMITQDPWVEKATVTRKLPATMNIVVIEREAAAIVAIGGELYLATREGDLFKKRADGDPEDLPMITGILPAQVATDRPGAVLAVKRLLDVAEDAERSGLTKRYPLQELHLDKDGSLVLTLGKEGIALNMGQPPYRDKIEEGSRILMELSRRKANASVIFLDNDAHPERVVVRMR